MRDSRTEINLFDGNVWEEDFNAAKQPKQIVMYMGHPLSFQGKSNLLGAVVFDPENVELGNLEFVALMPLLEGINESREAKTSIAYQTELQLIFDVDWLGFRYRISAFRFTKAAQNSANGAYSPYSYWIITKVEKTHKFVTDEDGEDVMIEFAEERPETWGAW